LTGTNADKAQAFANLLATAFQPHPPEPNSLPDDTFTSLLETPFQLEHPVNRLKRSEVQAIINLPPKKSPGYDLIYIYIYCNIYLCKQFASTSQAEISFAEETMVTMEL
jgi:hypothetical protein